MKWSENESKCLSCSGSFHFSELHTGLLLLYRDTGPLPPPHPASCRLLQGVLTWLTIISANMFVQPQNRSHQGSAACCSLTLTCSVFSLCRIYWRACQLCLRKPWRRSLPWVQLCRQPSSCCRPPEGACLSFRPSCPTWAWGRSSPERILTSGLLPRFGSMSILFLLLLVVPSSPVVFLLPGYPTLITSDWLLQEACSGLLGPAGGCWPVPAQLSVLWPGITWWVPARVGGGTAYFTA